ncbi:PepSY domain-containing protein [Bacillus marinisedimentorum]|uniref:PepSY domain-containing protein n=1 Tax=Bacillus marinisedimentorum TaxID=1821260 RepID=UPI000872ADA7|nr:PepSY domain-containing protein [Bacillus marinisedimentorum]
MNVKNFLIGAGIGAAAAVLLMQARDDQYISAERALKDVKDLFKEKGPIDGSWIHMVPEETEKFGLPYTVYRGGVSRSSEGSTEQYEFMIDAKTGSILEVEKSG